MPDFTVRFQVTGEVELEADDAQEAQVIARDALEALDMSMIDSFDIDEIELTMGPT